MQNFSATPTKCKADRNCFTNSLKWTKGGVKSVKYTSKLLFFYKKKMEKTAFEIDCEM